MTYGIYHYFLMKGNLHSPFFSNFVNRSFFCCKAIWTETRYFSLTFFQYHDDSSCIRIFGATIIIWPFHNFSKPLFIKRSDILNICYFLSLPDPSSSSKSSSTFPFASNQQWSFHQIEQGNYSDVAHCWCNKFN